MASPSTPPPPPPGAWPVPSVPTPDVDSAPWWEGLAEHRIVVRACRACDARFVPMMPGCPSCGAPDPGVDELDGAGTVYSYVSVCMPLAPGDEERVPYSVLTVDLDGGVRVFGRVVAGPAPWIGARVAPRFVDHDGWTELCFAVEETTGDETGHETEMEDPS